MKNIKENLNSEKIGKIWKSYKIWTIQKTIKSNSEKIQKIWRKGNSNSEKIWKLWKKSKLNSEITWRKQKKIVKREGKYRRKVS